VRLNAGSLWKFRAERRSDRRISPARHIAPGTSPPGAGWAASGSGLEPGLVPEWGRGI